MKGCFKFILLLAASAALLAGLGAWLLPGMLVRLAFERLPGMLATQGVHVSGLRHDSARLAGWRGVSLTGVAFSFDLKAAAAADRADRPPAPRGDAPDFFEAERITVTVASFLDPAVTFSVEKFNLVLAPAPGSGDFRFHRFENATWRQSTPIRLGDVPASSREIVAEAKQLLREGRIEVPFEFEGAAHFRLMGNESRARLYTSKDNGATRLRFDERDVRVIARALDVEFGDAGIALIAASPLMMPGVLEATMTAKKSAVAAARSDRSVPEDAYRHVLWSYLLTERFGPEFAKLVTDAQETVPGNTPDERAMDYHNNAVGRDLARRKFPRENILREVMTAPEVIRRAEDVRQRDRSALLDQP